MALIPRLDVAALDEQPLDPLTKGLPFGVPPMRLGDVGGQGWSLLAGDIPLPAAIIREDILRANSAWMRDFTAANDLLLAPHGKTTMSPHLFDLQIADGAWAITVATVQQLEVCRRFGVKRILLANQPVGRAAADACFGALRDEALELYCLADGEAGLALLADATRRNPPPPGNPLRILVEAGFTGGRTGARTRAEALALARGIAAMPGLQLAGFECFEGVLPTPQAADELIDDVAALASAALDEGLVAGEAPVVISAGGSSFFDRVGERFDRVSFSRPVLRVLRSGCYLTHDTMGYAKAFQRIVSETTLNLPAGGLEPALEVWAYVQSRPEAGRVMLTMGKRDVGFDAGLPQPQRWYRPASGMDAPQPIPGGHETVALNDQHCHLTVPQDSPLAFGDMVGFGIGHPCTTFDKWSMPLVVDEQYRVTKALKTYF
ncbi:alanine racemase [Nitratireductor pacificus]|uniref:Alanine racemase domain-containing protein n=1 Tax=Nitratireductor pacificus pht-3B TaxID=391937 RepID=K2LL52_9HYPH|nr:alanine racemase [Nitratireductor pacificus]EKF18514.1 alanine racemase domain-containing protein [Nitratireductor pacificus pht-3B]